MYKVLYYNTYYTFGGKLEYFNKFYDGRSLLKVITSKQIRFLGHVLRKNELEAIALSGKIEGKRA